MDKYETLIAGLNQLEIDYSTQKLEMLKLYISEIELWNKKYKLVGSGGQDLIIRHVLDSLSAVSELRKLTFSTVADVGSGAGLPGIPLAIFFPEAQFFLIERSGRRAGFLRNIISLLNIMDRVFILEADLEEINNVYDLVLFRAFRNLVDYYGPLKKITAPGGSMFAYKGRLENINTEILSLEKSSNIDIKPAYVPFLNEERNFLIFTQFLQDIQ
jgi:16S rRNA (guanine527-N7)-methyltransferase